MLGEGRLFAVWPAPFEHDACLRTAGFTDFADSDPQWDAEFARITGRLLDALSELGVPNVRHGEFPNYTPSVLDRLRGLIGRTRADPEPTLADMVVATASSDQYVACVIDFGAPARVTLRVCDGHCIFWIHLLDPDIAIGTLLTQIAEERPSAHTKLEWRALVSGSEIHDAREEDESEAPSADP
jgi:hypothetical protein